MKKRIVLGFGLFCLLGLSALTLWAASGRESKYLPPQEVEIMYATEDHAYQLKDINDAVRWKVLPDGTMATYDPSGITIFNTLGSSYLIVDSEAGAELSSVTPQLYLVDTVNFKGHTDTSTAGVSLWLPQGSAGLDGKIIRIVNVGLTGTTDVIVVPAGGLISGITDVINGYGTIDSGAGVTGNRNGGTERTSKAYDVADAHGESVTYIYRYATSGGTWYQINRN